MKRIGIVGLGLKNPYTYTPILRELGADVVAVFDDYLPLSEAFAKDMGASLITTIEEYPLNIDGVIVTSINSNHIKYAKYFLEPDCRRYRWTDNPFCIYKMTCLVLNGSHCNPFLAAIADDQNERFNFMRSSRAGDGRIHIDDTTSFWIEEDCFQVESELDLTAQNDNWQQEKQIWKWKILPGTDLIQQGREVLKWLCDNCRIPGEESE